MLYEPGSLRDVPFHFRMLSVLSNVFAPYLVFLSVTVTRGEARFGIVFSFISAILIQFAVAVLAFRWNSMRNLYLFTFGGSIAAILIWLRWEPFNIRMVCFVVLMLGVLYRTIQIVQSDSLTFSMRKAFQHDCGLILVAVFLAFWIELGYKGSDFGLLNPFLVVLGFVALYVRLGILWKLERTAAGANPSPRWGMLVLILGLIGVLVVCWYLENIPVVWLFFLFMLLSISILWNQYLILIVDFLIRILIPTLVLNGMWYLVKGSSLMKKQGNQGRLFSSSFSGHSWIDWAVWAVICFVIGWLAWKKTDPSRKEMSVAIPASTHVVRRAWIQQNERDIKFVSTQHPIRLQYQKALRLLWKKGLEIKPYETPRQYYERVAPDFPDGYTLTRLYEQARYQSDEEPGI